MKDTNLTWRYAKSLILGMMLLWVIFHVLLFFPVPNTFKIISMIFAVIDIILMAFVFNFFRNPERHSAADEKSLLSPADGKVVAIEELVENEILKVKMKRIAVFLNIFDVHVNRTPYAGKVTHLTYTKGKFLNAMDPECSNQNERQLWVIDKDGFVIAVRVIAGLIARRIIPWREVGDELHRGDRIGIIKFGSRTELYVPMDCEVTVKVGQRVKGGETVLAKRP
ncbi:MAG: phosphatidylserine decarboxylase family protein [Verrucomicrobiota bacterium]|nr:phosphatidylserine decarboxylase family protein [Verrucomicrobiota bacterium]